MTVVRKSRWFRRTSFLDVTLAQQRGSMLQSDSDDRNLVPNLNGLRSRDSWFEGNDPRNGQGRGSSRKRKRPHLVARPSQHSSRVTHQGNLPSADVPTNGWRNVTPALGREG